MASCVKDMVFTNEKSLFLKILRDSKKGVKPNIVLKIVSNIGVSLPTEWLRKLVCPHHTRCREC